MWSITLVPCVMVLWELEFGAGKGALPRRKPFSCVLWPCTARIYSFESVGFEKGLRCL